MKKIAYLLVLSLIAFSCETSDNLPTDYPDSGWIEFDSASSETFETQPMVSIPMSLPYGTNEMGQEVTYSAELISGTVPNGNFGTFTTTLVAGEDTGAISFDVSEASANYEVLFTLLSTSHPDYQIGLSDGTKIIQHTLKVCNVEVMSDYTANPIAFDAEAPEYTATLTPVPGTDNEFTIDSAWGPNFVAWATGNPAYEGAFLYSGTVIVNFDDYTVEVIGDDAWASGGTGTFDPCNNEITFEVGQALFSNPFTVVNTLSIGI